MFLGVCVSSVLYGVTCLQTFSYYRSAKGQGDGPLFHTMVAALLIFDTVHQAIVIHIVYNYLVLDFVAPLKVLVLVWSLPAEVVMNAILALILNSFLSYRIWLLSRRNDLTFIATALTVANFGTNLAYGIRGFFESNIFDAQEILRTHGLVGLSISVATEFMISTVLAWYLHRSRTGLRTSNDIITKLIMLTITTGMLTTLVNVADLIAYITADKTLYVLFFNFLLGKLYSNALLTSLNSREYVMGLRGDGSSRSRGETIQMSVPHTHVGARSGVDPRNVTHGIHITMEQLVHSGGPDVDGVSSGKFEGV
ncbi:hypothetical protein C8Q78DRAFT_294521 [Trametes maxima]|nr:hypothetical protein C8Q78DRAFT_294521 [Trametes maxima]